MPIQKTTDPALAAGRRAYERRAWGEAFESLSAADAAGALALEDLERLGIAAWLTGRPEESVAVGARAHLEAIRDGNAELGIRVAVSLGMALMERNEMAQAGGWLARAERLIEETGYDGPERGRLLIPERAAVADVGRSRDRVRDVRTGRGHRRPVRRSRPGHARPARAWAVPDRDERGPAWRSHCSTRR